MRDSDLDRVSGLIRAVAAAVLLPLHGRLGAGDAGLHADGSPFTAADLECERRLRAGLRAIAPGALVLGEEQISDDPAGFLAQAQGATAFIIDPVDGTGAFMRGEDTYGVMVACVHYGETVAGWLYRPGAVHGTPQGGFHAAQDRMIVAARGAGAFMDAGGTKGGHAPVRLDLAGRAEDMADARVAFACRGQDAAYEAVLAAGAPGYRTRHNACHDYMRLLTGETDATFYSEGYTPRRLGKCPPWDHAAGVLAVREAGGHAALPYGMGGGGRGGVPYVPLACHDRLLACANAALFGRVMDHVLARAPELCAPRHYPPAGPAMSPAP